MEMFFPFGGWSLRSSGFEGNVSFAGSIPSSCAGFLSLSRALQPSVKIAALVGISVLCGHSHFQLLGLP